MDYPVTFICRTCEDINKSLMGTDKFIIRDTIFHSLSDSIEHLLSNEINDSYHQVEAIIEIPKCPQ